MGKFADFLRDNPKAAAWFYECWERAYVPLPMMKMIKQMWRDHCFDRKQLERWEDDGGHYESRN